ncbi:MAG: hypothetical protein KC518_11075 [Candidatus Cloacimonetes bacterium]|nr:hypothetical protein [Candidatus Cloacimonadota bacterium]
MTVGERFVKELMSRDLPRDMLDYEQLQYLKTLDSTGELRAWLSLHVFQGFDDSDEISDIVDQCLIPYNKSRFTSTKMIWAWTIFMGLVTIAMIVMMKGASIVNMFLVLLPVMSWYAGQKFVREKIKNPKYRALVSQEIV